MLWTILMGAALSLAASAAASVPARGIMCSSVDGPNCAALIGGEPRPAHVASSREDLDHVLPRPDGSNIILQTEKLFTKIEFMGYLANSMQQVEREQARKYGSGGEDEDGDDSAEAEEAGVVFLMTDDDDKLVGTSPNARRRQALMGQNRGAAGEGEGDNDESRVRVIQGSSHGLLEQVLKEALARAATRLNEALDTPEADDEGNGRTERHRGDTGSAAADDDQ